MSLKRDLTPFVGRSRSIRRLVRLVGDPDVRLVTLLGPGGIGKTRLSVRVAEEAGSIFPDGCFPVSLAAVTDAELILPRLAEMLTVGEGADRPLIDCLATALDGRQALVLLDNLEQIAGAGSVVARLLDAAPTITVLATSRSPLRIHGEHEYPLVPFSLPPATGAISPDTLMETEAGAFFVQSIRRLRPDFAVTDANARDLAEICRRLDGLPLALELAAARIKMFTPKALRDRLHRRLPMLTAGHQDREARQQTMRQAIAWSYDLLPPAHQRQFRRLALFRDGFSLAAAESYLVRLAENAGEAIPDVMECVAFLMDQSLVTQQEGAESDVRFGMLETIREYGIEQLAAAGEEDRCQQRYGAYWLGRAESTWQDAARLEDLSRTLAHLELDHANITASLEWLAANDPGTAWELSGALYWFWYVRGHHGEADRWFRYLFSLPEVLVKPRAKAQALMAAGAFAHFQADSDRARTFLTAALEIWRALGDGWGAGFTTFVLGVIAEDSGAYLQARALFEEAVTLLDAVDDRGTTSSAQYHLAVVAFGLGEYDRAREILSHILVRRKDQPVLRVTSWAQHLDGLLCFVTGDAPGALERLQTSIRGFYRVRTSVGLAEGFAGLAVLAAGTGQPIAARFWGVAEHLMYQRGDTFQLPERSLYEASVDRIRLALDPQEYERQMAIGRAWSLDEAVAEAMAMTLPAEAPTAPEDHSALSVLSDREREVLGLVADGWTNDRIAEHLFLSPRTVQTHLTTIYRKLDVANRTEAARVMLDARS